MSFLQTLVAFLIAILLLVSLHELGHLLVARWCGIKVLRFSVGFGTPFYTKRWLNIEWCLAPIPLGGYVKMVDTREGNVSDEDLPYAFDKQHPFKRIATVAAGPLTNLVLAVLLYWVSFVLGGVHEVRPIVGTVHPNTLAAQAGFQVGDQIVRVNGEAVRTFADVQTQIVLDLEAGKVLVDVETAQKQPAQRIIDAAGTPEAEAIAKRQSSLGLSHSNPAKKSASWAKTAQPPKQACKKATKSSPLTVQLPQLGTTGQKSCAKTQAQIYRLASNVANKPCKPNSCPNP